MKQPKLLSLFETLGGTALGYVISLAIQYGVCAYYGLPLSTSQNAAIIGVFTIASLVRGYFWRRVCEALHVRRRLTPAMLAVIAERFRQIDVEGFSREDDAEQHRDGELRLAGACYIMNAGTESASEPHDFPWPRWWKPAGYRRDLVRGIALAIAELERFDSVRSKRERRAVGIEPINQAKGTRNESRGNA